MVRMRMIEAGQGSPQLAGPRFGRAIVARADLEPPRRATGRGVGQPEGVDDHAADVDERAAAFVGKGLDAVRADGVERRGGDRVVARLPTPVLIVR